MTKSSPADLAVTFRSLARRRREALAESGDAPMADLDDALRGHIAAAAAALDAPPDADAVAAAIASRPADGWDDASLDELRRHALGAGVVIRSMQARADDQA